MTEFIILGEPVPKERARVYKGKAYTPLKTKAYEEQVAWAYRQQKGKFYGTEPLKVGIQLFFQPPKSITKKQLIEIEKGNLACTSKKDLDNIAKSILDGLNHVAYKDDKQIVELHISKQYTLQEALAKVKIERWNK